MDFLPSIMEKIFHSGKSFADLLFLATTIYTAVISTILFFHWKKYAMGGKFLATMEVVYLVFSAVFLATAFFNIN